jgi:hypothetical protein
MLQLNRKHYVFYKGKKEMTSFLVLIIINLLIFVWQKYLIFMIEFMFKFYIKFCPNISCYSLEENWVLIRYFVKKLFISHPDSTYLSIFDSKKLNVHDLMFLKICG